MAIHFVNKIEDQKKAKEIVCTVYMSSGRPKHSNHLKLGESDSVEWGTGGECDDKAHEISVKVNLSGKDAHPYLENIKNGDTIVVKYDSAKEDGKETKTFPSNPTATCYLNSHRGYYLVKE